MPSPAVFFLGGCSAISTVVHFRACYCGATTDAHDAKQPALYSFRCKEHMIRRSEPKNSEPKER
jgi:hypothetical protein